jgi:nitroimidazol reductase NimA-like FMN-containing flavoprotein (pyridoxamine 5'-phosphate oxidase superfamily)
MNITRRFACKINELRSSIWRDIGVSHGSSAYSELPDVAGIGVHRRGARRGGGRNTRERFQSVSEGGFVMPKLTDKECQRFLEEPGLLMDIATLDSDGWPAVCPIWYVFEEGETWFTPRQHSEWLENIRRDSRVALCIDEIQLPYRKVIVQGHARVVHEVGQDDLWRDRYRRIAERYLPQRDANQYVDVTDDQPRALCAVKLGEAEVKTWRMPLNDEQYQGIWAKRYWTKDAKAAREAPHNFTQGA